jgi:hypothetical protein
MSLRIQGAVDNDIHPPLFGLAERAFSLYRALAERHAVRVLCVVPNRSGGAPRERAHGVELVRARRAYTSLVWRMERAGWAPMFAVADWHRRWGGSLARALDAQADVWSVDGINLAWLLERRSRPLRVYLAQNVETDFFRTAGPRVTSPERWAARLHDLERRAVRAADLVVTVSHEDADRLSSLHDVPAERFEVVENGFDETRLHPPSLEERRAARARFGLRDEEQVGVFVGSDFPHNREAARLLIERVYPELAGAGRHRLLLVGGVAAAFANIGASWLTRVPPTPDLLACLHAADVGLNPVTGGGGSNVKLPTYLAAGLPVVTTPFGLRGYRPLSACVVQAEPSQLVAALHAGPRPHPGTAAAIAPFAWRALGRRLGERYERALGGATAAAALGAGGAA